MPASAQMQVLYASIIPSMVNSRYEHMAHFRQTLKMDQSAYDRSFRPGDVSDYGPMNHSMTSVEICRENERFNWEAEYHFFTLISLFVRPVKIGKVKFDLMLIRQAFVWRYADSHLRKSVGYNEIQVCPYLRHFSLNWQQFKKKKIAHVVS